MRKSHRVQRTIDIETNRKMDIQLIGKFNRKENIITIETYRNGCLDETTVLGPRKVEILKELFRNHKKRIITKHFRHTNIWEN